MHIGTRVARAGVALAITAAAIVTGVVPAVAIPTDCLGLAGLEQEFVKTDGEPVEGYLKTVLRGSTVETIAVDIVSITSDAIGASNGSGALIVFESDDPKIEALGGIASGMSGSPIYVDDGTGDKIVGALSYGDWFTTNGFGLATPIEAMLTVADYPTSSLFTKTSLSRPVATSDGLVKDIVVTDDPDVANAARHPYTFVAKPLAALSVGGLAPSSPAFKKLAARVRANGHETQPAAFPLGGSAESFETTFSPGASAAAMVAWGDFWVGGIGTATYVDGEKVLAFGHPMDWDGSSHYALANAWIDYTVPSAISPWKLGRPGKIRGRVTQDRGAAILGRTDVQSVATTITSNVRDNSINVSKTGATYMPRALVTSGDWWFLPASAVYSTALRACDDYWYVGSALTTTTVVVSDGSKTYSVTRRNVWDSSWDVAFESSFEVMGMLDHFYDTDAEVLSVDFEATLDTDRVSARIVDVELPSALKAGAANTVRVSVLKRGNPTTQTIDVTLNLPAGTPTTGELFVSGSRYSDDRDDEDTEDMMDELMAGSRTQRLASRTTSDAVDALNKQPMNSDLSVVFSPFSFDSMKMYKSITTTASTPWFLTGYADKETAYFDLELEPSTADYNTEVMLLGEAEGIYRDSVLELWGRSVDSTMSSLVATIAVEPDEDYFVEFEEFIFGLKKNTVLTVRFAGDKDTLLTEASKTAKVRADIKISANDYSVKYGKKVQLTATLRPTTTAGKVVFQRYRSGAWRTIATKTIVGGKATTSFTPSKGKNKVRAKYLGGTVNAAKTSGYRTVTAQ